MLGHVGLIRLVTVFLIFKKTQKSAVTSVKGGPMLKVKASPVKNSQKRTLLGNNGGDVPYRLVGGGTNPSKGMKQFEMKSITSYSDRTHSGVRVRGSIYMADAICPVGIASTSSNFAQCRTTNIEYLHPQMISSKVAKLAKAFRHYRFERVRLIFQSATPTSSSGEILLAVTQDVTTDPSPLVDRRLRAWYDSIENSASMPVYGSQFGAQEMPWVTLTLDKAWFEISQNTMDVADTYQAKLFVAFADAGTNYYGDLRLEFDLLLVDQEETVYDILKDFSSAGNAPNIPLSVPIVTSGDDVQWTQSGTSLTGFVPGLYSLMDYQDISPAISNNWTKGLITVGVEFILAITGYPGASTLLLTLYDTLADFASNNPTEATTTTAAANLTWVGNALLYDSNSYGAPPSSSYLVKKMVLDRHPTWRSLNEKYVSLVPGHAVGKQGIFPIFHKPEVVQDYILGPTVPTRVEDDLCDRVQSPLKDSVPIPTTDDKVEDPRKVLEVGSHSHCDTDTSDDDVRIERIRQYLSRFNYSY